MTVATLTLRAADGSTSTLDVTLPITAAPLPLLGAAFQTTADCSSVESPAHRPVGVHRTYWSAGQEAACVAQCRTDRDAGRVPWPSFKVANWATAKTGAADSWALGIYTQLAALNCPLFLTWHHEPETNAQWASGDFVPMADRLYSLKPAGTQIKVGPILVGYNEIFAVAHDDPDPEMRMLARNVKPMAEHFDSLWTGKFTSGDFVGMDAYMYAGTAKGGSYYFYGVKYWPPIATFAASKGVPWGIGEFGVSNDAATTNRTQTGTVSLLTEAYATATSLGGCLVLAYFDCGLNSTTNVSDGTPAWPLDTDKGTPSKLSVFNQLLNTTPLAPTSW